MISQLVRHITPDDQYTWSKDEIATEIPGFHFAGSGWYSKDGTWMLIVGTDTPDIYTILVFYDRDPRDGFLSVAEAAVHSEDKVVQPEATTIISKGLIVWMVGILIMLLMAPIVIHKFHNWGWLIFLGFGFIWGQVGRFVSRKKKEEKKDERASS